MRSRVRPCSLPTSVSVRSRPSSMPYRILMMDAEADGAGLVGDGARDGLADPPRRVRGELEALAVVELLDRAHQARVPLLDEVEQGQARARVTAGYRDHQAQVRPDEDVLGLLR